MTKLTKIKTINLKCLKQCYFIFNFIFLFSFVSKAQIIIKNISLFEQDKNILYVGVNNRIVVYGLKQKQYVSFKKSSCRLTKSTKTESEFIIEPYWHQGKDTLQIFYNNKVIYEIEYSIQIIADPICNLTNIENNIIKKGDNLSNSKIKCFIPNNILKVDFKVISFNVSSIHNADTIELYQKDELFYDEISEDVYLEDGTVKRIIYSKLGKNKRNFGSLLSEYQIKKIMELESNEKLLISNILVEMPDRRISKFDNILIVIQE